jgi:integrase
MTNIKSSLRNKAASSAAFSFIRSYSEQNSEQMKHVDYRSAKLYKGKKVWFVLYSFRNPKTGKFKRFKVFEDINRIRDPFEKNKHGLKLVQAINLALKEGFNPFEKPVQEIKQEPKTWTLGQGLNYFKQRLPEMGIRKRSAQTYQSVLKMLNKRMAPLLHKDVREIKKIHIQAALSNNEWSNTTFNNNVTIVRRIFNFFIDSEILKDNPAKGVKPKPETIKRHRPFEDEVWKEIKENAPPDLLEFILFLYHTGMRPNEARQIKYEHIKGDKILIPGDISKNRKHAYIPASNYIQERYKGKGLIFGTSVNFFSGKFLELKRKLKLSDDYDLYSIKATRAVHLANDGASPYSIMQLFRHSSLEMTQRYLRGLGLQLNRESVEKGIRF